MARPVKKKQEDRHDPQIIPRYQAMSTWKPRHMRGVNNGQRGKR